ncbi:hypothetical protein RRG08_035051 [Elysia crispata]|uniref:Uncharacterized protein n=1 Tax=Elysia crispata TaxID=231223 RepID=A0AAE0ZS69_9GAST|nr:hypothetical protein RRG08_035051 [Elysia crispata]
MTRLPPSARWILEQLAPRSGSAVSLGLGQERKCSQTEPSTQERGRRQARAEAALISPALVMNKFALLFKQEVLLLVPSCGENHVQVE